MQLRVRVRFRVAENKPELWDQVICAQGREQKTFERLKARVLKKYPTAIFTDSDVAPAGKLKAW